MTIFVRRITPWRVPVPFGAPVLALMLVLFSMVPVKARPGLPEHDQLGAAAGAAPDGGGGGVVRLAAETHERQRELYEPRDSALEDRHYYPGRGYGFPGAGDLLFGQERRSPARNTRALLASFPALARAARAERRYCRSTARASRNRL